MIVWNVEPEIFELGPIVIRWYGLLFALGFIIGFQIEKWMYQKENVAVEKLDHLLTFLVVGTVVGARLGHCLFYEPDIYLRDPIRILKVWEGGLASHGGVIGVLIAVYVATRTLKLPSYLWALDRIAVPTALASCFIRLGNLFNSEIIGHPTQVPWGVVFMKVDPVPRHPTQVYEAICYFLTFVILLGLYKKKTFREAPGFLTGLMFVLIFSARFIIEFFKENQVDFEAHLPLDMGQLLSIPTVILGFFLIYRSLSGKIILPRQSNPEKA